jgi:hypothetical protein
MSKQVIRIAPWQAGKLFALIYFVLSFFLVIPLALVGSLAPRNAPGPHFSVAFFVILPFLYALGALIFVPIGCWIYNWAAKLVGGLEVSITDRLDI